jgi:bacteriocin-like protein
MSELKTVTSDEMAQIEGGCGWCRVAAGIGVIAVLVLVAALL